MPRRGHPLSDTPGAAGEATSRRGRYRARHARRRSTARKVLLGVNIAVAMALVVAISAFGYAEWRLNQIGRVHIKELTAVGHSAQSARPAGTTSGGLPMTILIVGSDSRAALKGTASANQYGSAAQVGGARSDTIILARLVPATKQISLLSIPRDLWVPIAGMGHQKINTALGVSPDLLIQTIHDQLGIDVNHYVDVDFQSFKDIASAVGGVKVYFPTPARDFYSNLVVPAAGCTSLAGDQALAFVRSREYQYYTDGYWHQEALSDLARIQRQQIFIRKMVKKAETVGLTNPITLNSIIGGVTRNLTVDDSLSVSTMISLAETFRSTNADAIQGLTLPTYAETLPGPNDVLMPEPAQDKATIDQFLAAGAPVTPPGSAAPSTTTETLPVLGSTTTTSSTTVPVSSVTLPTSYVSVRVDNGSGVPGQAGTAAAALRSAGFAVVGTGTAPSYSNPTSIVEYSSGYPESARTLAERIGGGATIEQVSGLGSTIVLITGDSYTGVLPVGSTLGVTYGTSTTTSTSTSTTSSTTSTSVPASPNTTYALPGAPAVSTADPAANCS